MERKKFATLLIIVFVIAFSVSGCKSKTDSNSSSVETSTPYKNEKVEYTSWKLEGMFLDNNEWVSKEDCLAAGGYLPQLSMTEEKFLLNMGEKSFSGTVTIDYKDGEIYYSLRMQGELLGVASEKDGKLFLYQISGDSKTYWVMYKE